MTTKFPAPDMKTFAPHIDDINIVAERLELIARTLREATHSAASCKAARDIALDSRRALLIEGPAAAAVLALAARCETYEHEKREDDDEGRRFLAQTTRLTAVRNE